MENRSLLLGFAIFTLLLPQVAPTEELRKPHIGFTTTLTGDGALSGAEMRNAAELGNELLASNAFELSFADERCLGAPAAAAARKFTSLDKIDYAMGFFCNVSLLTAVPIYVRAGVPVLSSCATTMDKPDVGRDVYRLLPADQLSIPVLHSYAQKRFKKIGILAEEDAYAQMLRREFVRLNEELRPAGRHIELIAEDYPFEASDFRSLLLRMKASGVEALFIDSATESTFIRIVRQMHDIEMPAAILGVYTPVSQVALRELGPQLHGAVASTLPALHSRSPSPLSQKLLKTYEQRFGPPQSAFPVVVTTLEAMRLVTIAQREGRPLAQVINDPEVLKGSLLGPYRVDPNGAMQGVEFVLMRVTEGGDTEQLHE